HRGARMAAIVADKLAVSDEVAQYLDKMLVEGCPHRYRHPHAAGRFLGAGRDRRRKQHQSSDADGRRRDAHSRLSRMAPAAPSPPATARRPAIAKQHSAFCHPYEPPGKEW